MIHKMGILLALAASILSMATETDKKAIKHKIIPASELVRPLK